MASKPPNNGPTIPCPLCGTPVRSIYNPHTATYTIYHGEDELLSMMITEGPALTADEYARAAGMLRAGTIMQVATLHGVAA